MPSQKQQLEAAIAALEAQRSVLGDAVVDASVGALRAQLGCSRGSELYRFRADAEAGHHPVPRRRRLDRAQPASRPRGDQRRDGRRAVRAGTAIVEAHRGKVLQYAGDSILAVFGADEAREDDAERAVRCGLALLELGKALGAEVQAAHGHAASTSASASTPAACCSAAASMARAAFAASPSTSPHAWSRPRRPAACASATTPTRQVRGLFEVEAQAPLAVKGVDEPIAELPGAARQAAHAFGVGTRGIEGVATRMIGRDAELEALQDAFKRLFIDRKLAAVTVVADAGIGKSRLLYEFAAWSDARPERFIFFRGRATPQTQGQPFGLLRDILAWRFQIADDDSIEAARRKMEQGIVPLFLDDDGPDLAEGHAHLLGHLIGIEWRDSRHVKGILDDPQADPQPRLPRRGAAVPPHQRRRRQPVVLQLEDLHWADNESLDFLAYLAEVDRDVPLLMLACCRPTLFERRASWCAERGPSSGSTCNRSART